MPRPANQQGFWSRVLLAGVWLCVCSHTPVSAKCHPSPDCSSCLVQGSDCTWCYKQDYANSLRCDTLTNHIDRGCELGSIMDPSPEYSVDQNDSVRNANLTSGEKAIQISPQKISLTLMPGRSVKIPITFRIAQDYPVDLYYIMDLSFSMKDDQDNLIRLGELIAQELKKITRDVRLGFGAFVDKAAMPFAGTRPESVQNPCFPRDNCAPMYGFKNQLSLTNDTSSFGDRVRETPLSGNQDGPEGGLDALLQAMVCQNQIGWRHKARHLVVVATDQHVHISGEGRPEIGWRLSSRKIILISTDAKSHIGGDAKLAGILEPNDGLCHLHNNEYTYTLRQDYPSISQIASVAKRTSTSIIFAVNSYIQEYEEIARLIPSSVVGTLADDSSNIVDLVRDKYRNLIKTVRLVTTQLEVDDGIDVTFKAACGGGTLTSSDSCNSVGIGDRVEFEAEIKLTSCLGGSKTKRFFIKPHDLADSIEVTLETECGCDCSDHEENSELCSGVGTYSCGLCTCNMGYSGGKCECDGTVTKTQDSCLNPLTNTTCSGFGECDNCGICQCDCLPGEKEPSCSRYSGHFCECNTKSCDRVNGLICGGNGECMCEELSGASYCRCHPGYVGDDCSCPISTVRCRANNGTGAVCNGRGSCDCGVCECTDPCYEGQTCEILKPECSRTCVSFRECVVCSVRPAEAIGCEQASVCGGHHVELVDQLEIDETCYYNYQEICKYFYTYQYDHLNDTWTISILSEPRCLKDYWLEIIIGLCLGILLVGIIALIVWKVVVTIHDKREFARFEKEALKAQWKSTENPLYKSATTRVINPMYSGKATRPVQL